MRIQKKRLTIEVQIEPDGDAKTYGPFAADKPLAQLAPGDRVTLGDIPAVVATVEDIGEITDPKDWLQSPSQPIRGR